MEVNVNDNESKQFNFYQKEIKERLLLNFKINLSQNWLKRYLFLYAHCVPNRSQTMKQVIEDIYKSKSDLLHFYYFINGHRAEYYNQKNNKDIMKIIIKSKSYFNIPVFETIIKDYSRQKDTYLTLKKDYKIFGFTYKVETISK